MLIFGLILLAVAVGCFVGHRNAKAKVGEILYQPTSTIAEIAERAGAVTEVLGSGHSSDYTEIKGEREAIKTLVSPLGKRDCLWFTASIEREWEQEERYRDDEGKQRTRIVSGSDTLMHEQDYVPFYVNDGSGRLKVDPERANIDLISSVSRFEQEHRVRLSAGRLSLGELSLSIHFQPLARQRRIKGYRFSEQIFEPSGAVYLLGTVVDRNGELTLVHPAEKEQRYIISHKSEEQLVEELDNSSKLLWWASIASAVVGLLLSLAGLISGKTGL